MKMRLIQLVLLACLPCASLKAQSQSALLGPRIFTDEHGRTLNARIIAIDEQSVTVRRSPENTEFKLQIEKLSLLDQAWLEHHAVALREALSPLPDTEFVRAIREDFAFLNTRATALESPSENAWSHTARFVILHGFPDEPDFVRSLGKSSLRIQDPHTAILWLGPGPLGGKPVPEVDLKLARILPSGVAVLRHKALLDGMDGARAELDRIANEQSPGAPRSFLDHVHRRTPAEREAWQARVRATLPPYWPTGGFLRELGSDSPVNRLEAVYVLDRDGAHLPPGPDIKNAFMGFKLGEAPPRTAPTRPELNPADAAILTNPATASSEKAVHEFTASDGRRLTARILSIGDDSVQVLRETDRKIFVFTRPELSAADWTFVQGLRQDPRYLPPPPADILPPRKNAETERSRAARFAVDLFLASNHGEMRRWDDRPSLVMENEFPEIADSVRWYYNDYCSAAGFTGSPDPTLEIVFVTGSAKHLNAKQKELGWSPRDIAGWQWQFYPFHEKRLRRMIVLVRIDKPLGADQQRRLFRCMAIGFGAMGEGGNWPGAELSDSGKAIMLSELDRHLLRTIYRHVPSGTSRDKFPALVSKHWVNPNAEPEPAAETAR